MDNIDQLIINAATRKPHRVWEEGTEYINNVIVPSLPRQNFVPPCVAIFVVDQRCGKANFSNRRITIPQWVFKHKGASALDHNYKDNDEKFRYMQWYVAHEFAHINNWDEKKFDHHGPNFMRCLIQLCPENAIHFETDYKPRNAQAAGISSIDTSFL